MDAVRQSRRYLLALGAVLAAGCSDSSPSTTTEPTQDVGILCQLGCIDPPPDVDYDGVFLGSGVTWTSCTNGSQTDADLDGLSDFCEKEIARAFAPELVIGRYDRAGREPKWAAKKMANNTVRVAYFPSYYTDDGPTTSWCNQNVSDLYTREACSGHFGDSEAIALDMYYNATAKRWLLHRAQLSAHKSYNVHQRTAYGPYPLDLEYPAEQGGHPRIYVSYQKHANYASDADCDSGAIVQTDICVSDVVRERLVAGNDVNLGSRAAHMGTAKDCWRSSNPVYAGITRTECYWTEKRFGGWNDGTPNSSPHSFRMTDLGF